jgi:Ca-activated chloride channel homolog
VPSKFVFTPLPLVDRKQPATDAGRLEAIFAQINQLEKAPVRVQIHEDVQDFYRVYLYWGVVFLLMSLFLKVTIVGNILED